MTFGVITERSEQYVAEPLVQRAGLKTEGAQPRIRTTPIACVPLRLPHQFSTIAFPAKGLAYGDHTHIEPFRPNTSQKSADNFAVIALYKERDRIPLVMSG